MKVLWIIPCKPGSSLDMLFARRGREELSRKGWDVVLFDFHLRASPWGLIKECIRIRRMCRSEGVDLVHAQFGSTTALLGWLSGKKFVITFRGTDLNGDPASYDIVNTLRRWLGVLAAHFATKVILVSQGLARHLIKSNYIINPSGTEVDRFRPIEQHEARLALGLSPDKLYIGFMPGGGRRVKRRDLALAVIEELKRRGHAVELLEIWNIEVEKVPLYLNSSEVVILCSEREGSPNIVREALACGVPVVSFDVGDVRKWLENDPFSRCISFGDITSMADGVENILKLKPSRTRRVDVEAFSVDGMVERLEQTYNKVIGG